VQSLSRRGRPDGQRDRTTLTPEAARLRGESVEEMRRVLFEPGNRIRTQHAALSSAERAAASCLTGACSWPAPAPGIGQ
jgi:hypothetical protein